MTNNPLIIVVALFILAAVLVAIIPDKHRYQFERSGTGVLVFDTRTGATYVCTEKGKCQLTFELP